MVKGKRNTSTFLGNVQSKSAGFCHFHRHIENNATIMQRNRSAHTAWLLLRCDFRMMFSRHSVINISVLYHEIMTRFYCLQISDQENVS